MANILVVDDYSDTADTTAHWLKLLGHNVQIARDGYQAIEIARQQRPSHVLLDIGLPGLDGYQVAAKLRQELAGALIIAVTGYGNEKARHRALAAGCDYHFLKPIDPDVLLALLSASNTGPDLPSHGGPAPESMNREQHSMLTVTRQVTIVNALGLHLRAADKLVGLARQFQADIQVTHADRTVSCLSILDLATLAAECGSQLKLEANGPDADAALNALTSLIERRFDEQA